QPDYNSKCWIADAPVSWRDRNTQVHEAVHGSTSLDGAKVVGVVAAEPRCRVQLDDIECRRRESSRRRHGPGSLLPRQGAGRSRTGDHKAITDRWPACARSNTSQST